jgi:ribosome maturation factor RimP
MKELPTRMSVADRISTLITPTLESMGYELVRVQIMGAAKNPTLQIMAERVDGKGMSVDDCETISHTVSAQLDVADPIASAYTLEVSSPGLDRPLTRLKDFTRFAGFEAKIQLEAPKDGQRNFKGFVRGVEGEDVIFETEGGKDHAPKRILLPFGEIHSARLVMNDALLKAASGSVLSDETATEATVA